jgi:hypothetical protein
MEDDLVRAYALEAQKAMEAEAKRRIEETSDPEEDQRLRNMSLHEVLDSEHLVPALCARLGAVRAALDGTRRRHCSRPYGGGRIRSSLRIRFNLVLALPAALHLGHSREFETI